MKKNKASSPLPKTVVWEAERPAAPPGYRYTGTGRCPDRQREGRFVVRWELSRAPA
jgi:hypothetical protein